MTFICHLIFLVFNICKNQCNWSSSYSKVHNGLVLIKIMKSLHNPYICFLFIFFWIYVKNFGFIFFRLVENLRNKVTWASGENTYLQRLESQISNTRQTQQTAFHDLSAVDVYHHDSNSVQDQLQVRKMRFYTKI